MKVGFVGLGTMGYNMVDNLLKKGFGVYTYDVYAEAITRTEKIGARGVSSLQELGEKADVILVMVMNFQQVQSVVLGEGGLVTSMGEDKVLVVSSTIAPAQTREIAQAVSKKGIHYVDCPVSGGKTGAVEGTLTMMAACQETIFERIRGVLLAMGSNTYHVSDIIGNGQVMKSINQVMIATGMTIVSEAVTMAVKSGLKPEMIYEVISRCTGCSDVFRDKLPLIMERDFEPRGPVDIFIKDLSIALDIGKEVKSPMFVSALVKQIFTWASGCGYGQDDLGALICAYEDSAKIKVEKRK
ncbi:MAG: NAD(P)-dependent oxidoreductase [Blautia sp.]